MKGHLFSAHRRSSWRGAKRYRLPTPAWIQAAELLMEEIRPPGQPVEVGSSSHYLQGLTHPRWLLGISAINSINDYNLQTKYLDLLDMSNFCLLVGLFFGEKAQKCCTVGRSKYNLDPQKMSNFSPKRSGLWWLRSPNFRPLEDSGYIYIYTYIKI